MFKAIDTDGDGSLRRSEINLKMMMDFGLDDEELDRFFVLVDTDGNGEIDEADWVAECPQQQNVHVYSLEFNAFLDRVNEDSPMHDGEYVTGQTCLSRRLSAGPVRYPKHLHFIT